MLAQFIACFFTNLSENYLACLTLTQQTYKKKYKNSRAFHSVKLKISFISPAGAAVLLIGVNMAIYYHGAEAEADSIKALKTAAYFTMKQSLTKLWMRS